VSGFMRVVCPHCQSYARIRTSSQISPVCRELYLVCTNDECGWRGKAGLEITYTLSPSSQPAPGVRIPISPGLLAQLMPEIS